MGMRVGDINDPENGITLECGVYNAFESFHIALKPTVSLKKLF